MMDCLQLKTYNVAGIIWMDLGILIIFIKSKVYQKYSFQGFRKN
jgi:hypothetical protein